MKNINPQEVISTLKKYVLVDGFHVVVDLEKSIGSYVVDANTGKKYLDCYSQFASQALGWNHPALLASVDKFKHALIHKIANSDMYSTCYAEFVEKFASVTTDFNHYFFIDGGALAVENALKAAFDWKSKLCGFKLTGWDVPDLDVIHLKNAFHGRSGYTMSLTNTGELKTGLYPKFDWTRISNPVYDKRAENNSLEEAEYACKNRNVAAIIIEPIQGEGGDNHFSKEYLQGLRALADKYSALLIFDEVQTGLGLTGKWWAYQHFDIIPDILCFGKKTQVCGICSTNRINEVKDNVFTQSGRINSTWGGNIVDMIRATIIIDTIKNENLLENANIVGKAFKDSLLSLENKSDVQNVRGRGLMLALDLSTVDRRDQVYNKLMENMLVLKCGEKGLRFRPHLTFTLDNVEEAIKYIQQSI